MTRLTEDDVTALTRDLDGVRGPAARGHRPRPARAGPAHRHRRRPSACQLHGARVAAVPMSSGEGVIRGFSRLRGGDPAAPGLRRLGDRRSRTCAASRRRSPAAAQVVFLADDHRFIALNLNKGCCVDDDPATADGYVTALEAAAGGLQGRDVLLLGLGPVGRAAARRLVSARRRSCWSWSRTRSASAGGARRRPRRSSR